MSFPNHDWQEEQDAPRWKPVKGKPNVYVHDDNPACEATIYRVECADCGTHALVMYSACGCDDHKPADEHDLAAHEKCPGCGDRMARLEVPEDGSWPVLASEAAAAPARELAAREEAQLARRRELASQAQLRAVPYVVF